MSFLGMAQVRGSTVTVRTPTRTRTATGAYSTAWADRVLARPVVLEEMTAFTAQKVWGQETEARVRMSIDGDDLVEVGDGVIVTDGFAAGERFRVVEGARRTLFRGTGIRSMGLARTEETFA